jgi:hypothetical protein
MGNKPKNQKPTTDSIARIGEAIKIATEHKEEEIAKLQEKLSLSPWIFEMAGKIKTMMFTETQAKFLKILFLKRTKETKDYRDAYGMTWEDFCKHIGISWRTADSWLEEFKDLPLEFSAKFADFSGYDLNKIKYLVKAKSANIADFTDHSIIFQGEEIPLTPEHKDEIQALFERIEEATEARLQEKDKQIEEYAGNLRAKDRVLEDLHKTLEKAHRRLDKLTRLAEEQKLAPEQAAFLSRMETLRLTFDGSYMAHLDADSVKPDLLDEDGKPVVARMRAAYLATLWYFKMQIDYAYGQAEERYGDPDMLPETAWKQPTLEELRNLKRGRSPSTPFPSGGETKSIKN